MMGPVDLLTYASFAVPGGRGGWSVGQRSARLTDEEVRKLTEQVPTRIDATVPVPQYPSADDLGRLQRRMAWTPAPWPGDDRVFWFSSPAGEDATGRAGNVFTQAHVFRGGTDDLPSSWPSDLLFSPSLRIPFGSREVNATTVSEEVPQPGPLADPSQLWPWIFADGEVDRRAVLGAILDGCASGRMVAVACPPGDAAMWVAAACLVQSPASARDFFWSTFERGRSLATARARGITLACIPVDDAGEASELSGVMVIRADETPTTGVYGGASTIVGGASVPVSEWSALLAFLFLSSSEAISFSTAVRTGAVTATVGGDPAWQLAAAAAADPELRSAAREPLAGLLAEPDAAPANLGEVLSGHTAGALADEIAGASGNGPAPMAALAVLASAGLFDDPGREEKMLESFEQQGIGAAIIRGGSEILGIPVDSDGPLSRMLRQIVATDPGLHRAIADGIGVPVEASRWLGVPQMAAKFLETMRGTPPAEFKAPVWEGDLIGAWVLGAMSDLEGTPARPGGGVGAGDSGVATGWTTDDWAAPSNGPDGVEDHAPADNPWSVPGSIPGGAPADDGPSAEMRAFGLNSLVESMGEEASTLSQLVDRELSRMTGPERALLAEGPWRPHLDALAAERKARKDAEERGARERDRRRREEEARALAARREEERKRAEEAAAAQRPRAHELVPAHVRYFDPHLIAEITGHAGLGLRRATESTFGLGKGDQAWSVLGEILLMAQRNDLPDMNAVRRAVFASAMAEALSEKWYPDTRGLPWWMVDDMTDADWHGIRDDAIALVRGSEEYRNGFLTEPGGGEPPKEARRLFADAWKALARDLSVKRSAQARTPRDIPAPGAADGGTGGARIFGKRHKRSDNHK